MALKRIQDLAPAAALDGSELIELEQGGASVQCTVQDIADLAGGGGGGGGGSGDVVGPASAVTNRIAVFDGNTGKLIKDSGLTVADLYFDTVGTGTIISGTVTLNCNGGRVRNFTVSMTASATLAVSNLAPAGRVTEFECLITQGATGGWTLTLPSSFHPIGSSDTAIAAAANAKTLLSAKTFDAGTSWAYVMQEVG